MFVPEASVEKKRVDDHSSTIREKSCCISTRRIPNQNIVHRLLSRETSRLKPGTPWYITRQFYKHIFPNFTVANIENPPCFFRKFSPNGQRLLAISADQTSVEIYEFKGDVMHDRSSRLLRPEARNFHEQVKENLFSTFFKHKHLVPVAPAGQHLNRWHDFDIVTENSASQESSFRDCQSPFELPTECSLFTEDSRYVIVASASQTRQDPHPAFTDIFTNNESISPNPTNSRLFLENYTIHVVDVTCGVLCYSREFNCDKIFLAHNQGLYLYHNVLAILSVQHQTIYIFQITDEGQLVETHAIGRFCFDDDLFSLSIVQDVQAQELLQTPYYEKTINSLKHRVLVHLFKQAEKEGREEVRRFQKLFNFLSSLRMWRMQLLDEKHLFIKYASEGVVSMRVLEPGAQPSFFVTYNIPEAKVLSVHENTSAELLSVYEKHPELFRPPSSLSDIRNPGEPGGPWQQHAATSANVHTLKIQKRFKETIINAKYGGHTEAIKRLLAQLPVPAQSHSSSPYFDLSLFSYDDKWISALERPRSCGDHPIRFYDRESGILKFRIYAGLGGSQALSSAKRLVAFTFHPFQPFAISVQRFNNEYVVNFHFRHVRGGAS